MKAIGIIMMCLLLAVTVIALEPKPLPRPIPNYEQVCIDNGHTYTVYNFNIGTFAFCSDDFGNECDAPAYAYGFCELVEQDLWTDEDWWFYNLSSKKIFEKRITKCNQDNDCYKINQVSRCGCNMGGREKAVNQLGIEYYNWLENDMWLGQYYCMAVYQCTDSQPKCLDKRCILE